MTPEQASASVAPTNSQDWSHIKETVNMLYLAICQIEATLTDSNKSVDTLTHSFTSLASHTHKVCTQIQNLTRPEQLDVFKDELNSTTAELQSNISASILAFQFYDRVCQRLDHVSKSLEKVSGLLDNNDSLQNPDAWRNVQDSIKSSYTMEAERIMFEYIMRGGSVKEALQIYQHHFTSSVGSVDEDNDEIELF